jgi:hypothetical protein
MRGIVIVFAHRVIGGKQSKNKNKRAAGDVPAVHLIVSIAILCVNLAHFYNNYKQKIKKP